MASQTEENYLKALLKLSDDRGEVNISELSNVLEVSKPSANSMVKKLFEQGFVNYEKYKPLSLTEQGKTEAALIIRKHRLTEMYLVKKMGFGWEEVHAIAEQVEHIRSPKLFERMDEILGYPSVDPHGSPIPDSEGKYVEQDYKALASCEPGDRVKFMALAHSSVDLLEFLNSRELKLDATLEIISKEPYDGSMKVSYENHPSEPLSAMVCDRLMVAFD